VSRIEINADGRHVVVDGDGNLDDLAKTAMDCGRSTMADAPTVPCGHVLVPSMMAEALTGVDPACPQCGVRMDRFDAL